MPKAADPEAAKIKDRFKTRWQSLLCIIGFTANTTNIWKFPYLMYTHGGVVFLIPFLAMTLLVGLPIYYLELMIGQYSGYGPNDIWNCIPIASGIANAMCGLCIILALYQNVILAYSLLYVFASVQDPLPWMSCDNYWNTNSCVPITRLKSNSHAYQYHQAQPFASLGTFSSGDAGGGLSINRTATPFGYSEPTTYAQTWAPPLTRRPPPLDRLSPTDHLYQNVSAVYRNHRGKIRRHACFCMIDPKKCDPRCITYCTNAQELTKPCLCSGDFHKDPWNCTTRQSLMNISVLTPVEEYWQNYVMEVADSFTEDPPAGDTPRWHLAICFIASTGVVAACLIKGIRTFSKVIYFTAIVPYFIMLTIFFLSVSRPGSGYGLAALLSPDFRKLYHPKTWYAAGVHVFSSLGLSLGSLILLGSYNTWNYDFVTDTFVSLGWDFFCNIVAAMTVFGAIGFLSHDHGLPVSFYASSGPDVAFVVFAEALSKHPFPQMWSFLYYLMIFCFGLNQAMITTDTLIDYLKKRFTRDYFLFTVFITIFTLGAFYIMGFSVITGLGYAFSRLILVIFIIADMYTFYPTFCVTLSECISLLTAYTFRYMRSDIKPLLSSITRSYVHWEKLWKQAIVILTVGALVTPVILVMMLLFAISTYNPFRQTICNFSRYYEYPFWIDELGWFFFCCFVLVLPVGVVLSLARVKGTLCQRIKAITSPSPYWAAQDEEADAEAREQLGIPVRIKPEPVRPKKPWEIHLEAYGKALALSEKELNKIKEREQRKRESREKLEGFCNTYFASCRCCSCCFDEEEFEEWEYEYESVEEEEEDGNPPSDDKKDDNHNPVENIEMQELRTNAQPSNDDDVIEENPKENPSDVREQEMHHKWECVRWVREIEDAHKTMTDPARSATVIVHECQSPEARRIKKRSSTARAPLEKLEEAAELESPRTDEERNKHHLRILCSYDGHVPQGGSPEALQIASGTPNALVQGGKSSRFKGHSPYKVAASEISQFSFPPADPRDRRKHVCLRQKRSTEDLDSSMEELHHNSDPDEGPDVARSDAPSRECNVGISTRHILDDIIRIESASTDGDDDEACDDEVEDDDEAIDESSLVNGAASGQEGDSGKDEDKSQSKRSRHNVGNKGKNRLAKFKMFQSWGIVLQDETVTFV